MLNPHVSSCENPPRFTATIRGSFSRQHFWFGLVFLAVDFVSRCHPVVFFLTLLPPSRPPFVLIAGCLSTLPRNAATVSSSKTKLKIFEFRDSGEKLYQPPDSGGKDLFSFFRFSVFLTSCTVHEIPVCVCVKKQQPTDHFNLSVIFIYFFNL